MLVDCKSSVLVMTDHANQATKQAGLLVDKLKALALEQAPVELISEVLGCWSHKRHNYSGAMGQGDHDYLVGLLGQGEYHSNS
jgi:hypothetical protein